MSLLYSLFLCSHAYVLNPLTPNDHYRGRTAPLTSKRCILFIYSTNIGTEYFQHGAHSPFFFSSKCSLFHNSNLFGSCIIHILYTGCAKIKRNNSEAKRLIGLHTEPHLHKTMRPPPTTTIISTHSPLTVRHI